MLRVVTVAIATCDFCKREEEVINDRVIPIGWLRTIGNDSHAVSLLDDKGRKVFSMESELTFCCFDHFLDWVESQALEYGVVTGERV